MFWLKSLVGKDVVVELKNDFSICGNLHSVNSLIEKKNPLAANAGCLRLTCFLVKKTSAGCLHLTNYSIDTVVYRNLSKWLKCAFLKIVNQVPEKIQMLNLFHSLSHGLSQKDVKDELFLSLILRTTLICALIISTSLRV